MEEKADDPIAVKVEEHSQCVILTYFQGDIGSMVDAHFSRALSKVCRAKAQALRTKKVRKPIKLEETSACQGRAAVSYPGSQLPPLSTRHLTIGPADEPPVPWHSLVGRAGDGLGLPPGAYTMSQEGLSVTGEQCATSLLNLLHSDRTEMGPSMASSSKPELLPSWMVPQGFRDSVDLTGGFETGRRLDKKDLYWY